MEGAADDTDEVFRRYPFGHSADGVGVHLHPDRVEHVPGDVEKLFGMVAVAEKLLLLFFGDDRDELFDARLVFLTGIQNDIVAEVGHHVAKFANFLRVGAVRVLCGRLRVG